MARNGMWNAVRIASIYGLALLPMTVQAAAPVAPQSCYTEAEFAAEQALRLHTELMVIGLSCGGDKNAAGETLFARYNRFTQQNRKQIVDWEKAMIGHFKRTGRANPTREFDSYRTRLANEVSQRVSSLSPAVFCPTHAPLVDRVVALAPEQVRTVVLTEAGMRMAALPRCPVPAAKPVKPATAKPATSKTDAAKPAATKPVAKPEPQG